jgi:hypothetical protein
MRVLNASGVAVSPGFLPVVVICRDFLVPGQSSAGVVHEPSQSNPKYFAFERVQYKGF